MDRGTDDGGSRGGRVPGGGPCRGAVRSARPRRVAQLRGRQRQHEVLAARPDHGRELRRPRGALALDVGRLAPRPLRPRRRLARRGQHPLRHPAGGRARPVDGVGRGAADACPAHHPLAGGDAPHGRRGPLPEHAALPGRRRRRAHRRDPVGAQPPRLRVGQPAGHRAVAPPRRGVLGERRRRPHRLGHRRRLPHLPSTRRPGCPTADFGDDGRRRRSPTACPARPAASATS